MASGDGCRVFTAGLFSQFGDSVIHRDTFNTIFSKIHLAEPAVWHDSRAGMDWAVCERPHRPGHHAQREVRDNISVFRTAYLERARQDVRGYPRFSRDANEARHRQVLEVGEGVYQ